ncbi:MAG: energy transducer TonB [Prevotellaceae bacterium]|jgi:TonB family protein|nr:energy transducer TonB [Prevotellaceae bacterium]
MSYIDKIRAYLQSERRGKLANELEREAMDDVFLNDALDGFASASDNGEMLADMDLLQENLDRRVHKCTRKHNIHWVATTAAVLLVLVTGYWVVNTETASEPQLAILKEFKIEQDNNILDDYNAAAKDVPADVPDDMLARENKLRKIFSEELSEKNYSKNDEKIVAPAVSDLKVAMNDIAIEAEQELMEEIQHVEAKKTAPEENATDLKMWQAQSERSMSLSNSNIRMTINDTNFDNQNLDRLPTITDNSRLAQINNQNTYYAGTNESNLSNRRLNKALNFVDNNARSSIQMQSNVSKEKPDEFNKFVDKQLDEVVVTGYGNLQKKTVATVATPAQSRPLTGAGDLLPTINKNILEPVIGMDEYEKYIDKQLVYPADARKQKKEGKVMLSFLVADNGCPYDIKIEKSLYNSCDEEAVRLINEGSNWNPSPNNPQNRVKYSISFKLK